MAACVRGTRAMGAAVRQGAPSSASGDLGVGEATVATLVRDHPQTGELDTLPEPVREPDSRRTSRREQLQELKGDEPERVDLDEVEGEVSEGLGVRALEQVRRDALAQAALRDLLAWLGDGRGERRALDSGGRLGDDRSTTTRTTWMRVRRGCLRPPPPTRPRSSSPRLPS